MSGVQTNWHLDGLDLPGGDPMQEIAELKSEAKVIDLSRGRAEIMDDLSASIRREGEFASRGLTCAIKHVGDTPPCYECPYFTTDFQNDARALICELGRHQRDLCSELEAMTASEALDDQLALAYETELAACEELAAALL